MDPETAGDQPQSLLDLLSHALQAVVFGNGFLAVAIFAVFVLVVVASRVLKGGSL